jgi:hypothetical protein
MSTPSLTPPIITFDTSSALAGLYLWLLFGFFTSLLGCDLQRLVSQNMYVKHFLALISFFFLFTLLDPGNRASITQVWTKTVLVYAIFVMSTKSKAWASILVLILLIVDQTIKTQINYLNTQETPDSEQISKLEKWRRLLYAGMIIVVVAGFAHYYIYQKSEYGEEFNFSSFLFGTPKCREM